MKKISFQMIIALVLMAFSGFSQRPTIELTFTAKYQSQHVMLDSIYIQNLTQPGDTMLFAPDTVMFLDYIISIPDYGGVVESSFSVSPNYPNPSTDGKTTIDVFIPKREFVTMRVFNILGNEVAFYENTLDAGNHHFTFLAGKARYYVLSVNCGNEIRSIKMINSGNSNQSQGRLIYQGMTEAKHLLKSQKAITGFDFSLGDQLRFIGYSKSPSGINGSDVIEATPQGNEDFVFEIIEGLPCPGIPTVTYEGQTYTTVQIGNQCWLKENLNVGIRINGSGNQTNNSVVEKYCYDDDPSNCAVYGGLYQWDEMMQYSTVSGAQGICPTSWHLPTDSEWTDLTDFLGGEAAAGGAMKETGTVHWEPTNVGAANSSGFTTLPGGGRDSFANFYVLGWGGIFWSSTLVSAPNAWRRMIVTGGISVNRYFNDIANGFSVRCVNDSTFLSVPTISTAEIIEIGHTQATGGGDVTDDGGAEVTVRGVCWSISQNPTIADNHTSDGTGTGAFLSNLTGLTPGTSYFVRAYATNSVGTAYGNEVDFSTLSAVFTCGSSITVNHIGGEVAPVDKTVTYGTVTNIPGEPSKCWITNNLGSDHQATTVNDTTEASAGWYWQFNRKQGYKHDGTTRTPNTAWIINIEENSDWIAENDPCAFELGNDWRIPTSTEWQNVDANGSWADWNGPWNSGLKLHAAGLLGNNDGFLYDRGSSGLLWSINQYSTTDGSSIFFSIGFSSMFSFLKAGGFPLRCITNKGTTTIPVVSTAGITEIDYTQATGGGYVTDDGGSEVIARGVCWSKSSNPTIEESHTSDGTGTGTFVSYLSGLTPGTLYFVRAYATNSEGTAYGNEVAFTTPSTGFTCGDILNYEGQDYNTVLISNQCWFKENLNIGVMINVSLNQTDNSVVEKYCFSNVLTNCYVLGGLYQWDEMMQYANIQGGQGICPAAGGWHVPSDNDWTILTNYVSSQPEYWCSDDSTWIAKALSSTTNWYPTGETCAPGYNSLTNNGTGFSARPCGMVHNHVFSASSYLSNWWSSTDDYYSNAKERYIVNSHPYVVPWSDLKTDGFSVRCVRSLNPVMHTTGITNITETSALGGGEVIENGGSEVTTRGVCWSTTQNPTITDNHTSDGTGTGAFESYLTGLTPNTFYYVRAYATNSAGTGYGEVVGFTTLGNGSDCGNVVSYGGENYNTVLIGNQCWFKRNLNIGSMINAPVNQTDNGIIEKYCYNNQESNCDVYGGFYQWDEMMQYTETQGSQGICPPFDGWHLPTDEDLTTLTTFLGGMNIAGGKLKTTGTIEAGTGLWNEPNTGATNSSGFSGLPGGELVSGNFDGQGIGTLWWSSTEDPNSTSFVFIRYLLYNSGNVFRDSNFRIGGCMVRCLKYN